MILFPFIATPADEVGDDDADAAVTYILADCVLAHRDGRPLTCMSCGASMKPYEIGALAVVMNGCCARHSASILLCAGCRDLDRELVRALLAHRLIAWDVGPC